MIDSFRQALSVGWNKESLRLIAPRVRHEGLEFVNDDAILLGKDTDDPILIYRSSTLAEISWALSNTFDQGEGPIVAYADGSGTTSQKVAGIGVALYGVRGERILHAENIGNGTNNRAELCAIWRALRSCPGLLQKIEIYSDSEYAIGALTQNWMQNKNGPLIEAIRADLALRDDVRLRHVDGHNGVEGNETADKLANIGRKFVSKVTDYGHYDQVPDSI